VTSGNSTLGASCTQPTMVDSIRRTCHGNASTGIRFGQFLIRGAGASVATNLTAYNAFGPCRVQGGWILECIHNPCAATMHSSEDPLGGCSHRRQRIRPSIARVLFPKATTASVINACQVQCEILAFGHCLIQSRRVYLLSSALMTV
jgi:hypothetical protein